MAEDGRPDLASTYGRSVRPEGNPPTPGDAAGLHEVDAEWQGLGTLPGSGLGLREGAGSSRCSTGLSRRPPASPARGCRCENIVRGALEPGDCPLFRVACTPARPAGPVAGQYRGGLCRVFPLRRRRVTPRVGAVTMAHGSGAPPARDLVRDLFLAHYGTPTPGRPGGCGAPGAAWRTAGLHHGSAT